MNILLLILSFCVLSPFAVIAQDIEPGYVPIEKRNPDKENRKDKKRRDNGNNDSVDPPAPAPSPDVKPAPIHVPDENQDAQRNRPDRHPDSHHVSPPSPVPPSPPVPPQPSPEPFPDPSPEARGSYFVLGVVVTTLSGVAALFGIFEFLRYRGQARRQ